MAYSIVFQFFATSTIVFVTYSVVARCPETGRFGVAVQTKSFAVGNMCPWTRAGVGAVVTQGATDMSYGYRGLARMGEGQSANDALEVAHYRREGVWADGRANEVVSGCKIGHPVAEGLIDSVFKGAGARMDGNDL